MQLQSAVRSQRIGAAGIRTRGRSSVHKRVSVVRAVEPDVSAADVCPTCGIPKTDIPAGCAGEGRIVGGMGALPGFGWWPIKAYRPCPKLGETGTGYVRKGQGTNEILFGGVSLSDEARKALEEARIRRQ